MMQVYTYPRREEWASLLKRPVVDAAALESTVRQVLRAVKEEGDAALKRFTALFDKADISDVRVREEMIDAAESMLPEELKKAILLAKGNIEKFHSQQLQAPAVVETMPGVKCWRKTVAIEKVGLYIPGGTAPLFSTILMLAIPARLAGCSEMVLCSPPDAAGHLHPAILFAARITGITKIFRVGGVQAIGAMAYGTASVPRVYKIFGPGNQYVTCAKQLVQQEGVAIDMPAGPSEVAVFADDTAKPAYVAADLLSQAEHGADSQVILVTTSGEMVDKVASAVKEQLQQLPRQSIAAKALSNSKAFVVKDEEEAIDLLNEYAAEHLILSCDRPEALADRVINAGSVFLGHYSPESAGDYASGTNHTLPTNGYAKAYSGVSMDSFVKKITYQQLSKEGLLNIGRAVELMAEAEGLRAHANAITVRMK